MRKAKLRWFVHVLDAPVRRCESMAMISMRRCRGKEILERGLTAMIRITKENKEIDKKTKIERIKQQAKKIVQ
ncbi:hypothetical protein H5410_061270 [Solanum commersonii]|uniref:Uncharacterized protein n=1 Tax=Solanum commersonii TaxID=4109 RepID=A0A9J5W8M6_SOLCO|nr:hypothetical protein H5410_061270 [Solanum commersonii]